VIFRDRPTLMVSMNHSPLNGHTPGFQHGSGSDPLCGAIRGPIDRPATAAATGFKIMRFIMIRSFRRINGWRLN
jgi:hypothetical protein